MPWSHPKPAQSEPLGAESRNLLLINLIFCFPLQQIITLTEKLRVQHQSCRFLEPLESKLDLLLVTLKTLLWSVFSINKGTLSHSHNAAFKIRRWAMTLGASNLKAHSNFSNNVFQSEKIYFRSHVLHLVLTSLESGIGPPVFLDFQDLDTSCRLQDSYFRSVWASSWLNSVYASLARIAQKWHCSLRLASYLEWHGISICPISGGDHFDDLIKMVSARLLHYKSYSFPLCNK